MMARIVRGGLIQCSNPINDEARSVPEIQAAMFAKHIPFIEEAGKRGVHVLCLQEIFNGPYFCPASRRAGTTRPSPSPARRSTRWRPTRASTAW
jgi:N-carbamoylputrescine amidase